MEQKKEYSLFNRIIKKEHNAAVIKDIILDGIIPYLKRLILAITENVDDWQEERIYNLDVCEYIYNQNTAVIRQQELSTQCQVSEDYLVENYKKITWPDLDLDNLDLAALVKILRFRLHITDHYTSFLRGDDIVIEPRRRSKGDNNNPPSKYGEDVKFYHKNFFAMNSFLKTVTDNRNSYEGHLSKAKIQECTNDKIFELISLLKGKIDFARKKCIMNNDKKCKEILEEIKDYLSNIEDVFRRITSCSIQMDSSKKYHAEDLQAYTVFIVYPHAMSDKYRRFCNDRLRTVSSLGDKRLYTDTGTISLLESLSLSSDSEQAFEAKQLIKTIYEPLHREGFLQVLKLDEEDKPKFFIDIESKKDEDLFFEKLQMIDDNVCVITDNIQLAKKIWSLNKNQNVIQKPMVALKVINKETVSPFF